MTGNVINPPAYQQIPNMQIAQLLAQQQQHTLALTLPTPKVPTFSGNPIDFHGLIQGILRNPDRTRTRTWTRTRRKPGLGKNPDSCSDSRLRNPDSTIENPDSKSKILDSMKLDSDNIRNREYIPIFNCLSETYNRNSQILR